MSVAKTYAKALFDFVTEGKRPQEVAALSAGIEKELDAFVDMLTQSKEMRAALEGPVTSTQEKSALIGALAPRLGTGQQVQRFLNLLAAKGRFQCLKEIREGFADTRLAAEGGVSGRLVSAEPMQEAEINGLADAFSKKLGKKVEFRVSTDPSLLAGVKVTVGGVTYDGTLRSQLVQLRDRFVASAGHA